MNRELSNQKSRINKSFAPIPSILGRSRKSSTELYKERPLKRASSISYKIPTPTHLVLPSECTLNRSQTCLSKNAKNQILTRKKSTSSFNLKLKTRFKSLRNFSNSGSNISPVLNSKSPPTSPLNQVESDDSDNNSETSDNSMFFLSDSFEDTGDTTFIYPQQGSSCETTPESIKIPKLNSIFFDDYTCKKNLLDDLILTDEDFLFKNNEDFNYGHSRNFIRPSTHAIFEIPEILEIILSYVGHDNEEKIPKEPTLARRAPLSYNHAVLIHGVENGGKIWQRSISNSSVVSTNTTNTVKYKHRNRKNLYNCLLVNKKWFYLTLSILNKNMYFNSDHQFENYTSTLISSNFSTLPTPKSIVLHKIKSPQSIFDVFNSQISSHKLKWLEIYICPQLEPPIHLITHNLEKLCLPGCRSLTDEKLIEITLKCPNLILLDLRACEQITDASIYFVGQRCLSLEMLNCGRHTHGELISDNSIAHVVRNCRLKTLGLAGCGITDQTIWELGIHRGNELERLSLNNCWKLSDMGICRALRAGLFNKIGVLEIRKLNLNDVRDVVEWKKRLERKGDKILIEACERLDSLLKNEENRLDLEISARMFGDIVNWLDEDDNDVDYRGFLTSRRVY